MKTIEQHAIELNELCKRGYEDPAAVLVEMSTMALQMPEELRYLCDMAAFGVRRTKEISKTAQKRSATLAKRKEK